MCTVPEIYNVTKNSVQVDLLTPSLSTKLETMAPAQLAKRGGGCQPSTVANACQDAYSHRSAVTALGVVSVLAHAGLGLGTKLDTELFVKKGDRPLCHLFKEGGDGGSPSPQLEGPPTWRRRL